ncbi:uncharacterized protein LOC124906086 isoform X2 [Homo sapiens]|uniref:uncharacterized protein LOC124906086 isoform X2 n=1 Tax=Homo sapiens TaxID=9606 RepID=UPI001FB136E2|nr:uncharacterized protein LOC124906086 isoform X2 [Homo sapiens]
MLSEGKPIPRREGKTATTERTFAVPVWKEIGISWRGLASTAGLFKSSTSILEENNADSRKMEKRHLLPKVESHHHTPFLHPITKSEYANSLFPSVSFWNVTCCSSHQRSPHHEEVWGERPCGVRGSASQMISLSTAPSHLPAQCNLVMDPSKYQQKNHLVNPQNHEKY